MLRNNLFEKIGKVEENKGASKDSGQKFSTLFKKDKNSKQSALLNISSADEEAGGDGVDFMAVSLGEVENNDGEE